jgi:hypothetical protein
MKHCDSHHFLPNGSANENILYQDRDKARDIGEFIKLFFHTLNFKCLGGCMGWVMVWFGHGLHPKGSCARSLVPG